MDSGCQFLRSETRDRVVYLCWRCSQFHLEIHLKELSMYPDLLLVAEYRRIMATWDFSRLHGLAINELDERIEEEFIAWQIEKEFLCDD